MPGEKLQKAEREFLDALEARRDALLEEVREADHEGNRRYSRIRALREERADLEARVSTLEAERETLPTEAYRAGLDEDYEREDDLKQRYKAAGDELSGSRERLREVGNELAGLLPNAQGHDLDAEIAAFRESVETARAARTEIEEIRDRLTKALDDALDPVAKAHESARGQMWSWNSTRTWQMAEQAKYGRTNAEAARQIQEREERERLRAKKAV